MEFWQLMMGCIVASLYLESGSVLCFFGAGVGREGWGDGAECNGGQLCTRASEFAALLCVRHDNHVRA